MPKHPDFFTEPHGLLNIEADEPVLVALSGGADSSALLHLLHNAAQKLGFSLYAAHVNHNIRTEEYGDEAARDEQFCRDVCKSLGITLFVHSADLPTLAKESKKSLETAARDVRYSFFAKIMHENGIKILATAHNADDNLETQIFNLARGCGIEGLCGIPQTRPFPEVERAIIVRPILSASKAEIIDYCKQNGVEFITDSTNFEDDCTRNRIRHNIIPELYSLFGSPQRAATRLSRLATSDAEYIDGVALDFIENLSGDLELDKLNSLHPSILSRVISISYKRFASSLGYDSSLEEVHIEAIIKLCAERVAHSSLSLPRKISVKIKNSRLVFVPEVEHCTTEDFCIALHDGWNDIPGSAFAVFIGENSPNTQVTVNGEKYELFSSTTINHNENNTLSARDRREGDVIRSGNMTKKVKKLLCDKKIALELRDSLPLICRDEQIIYVPACAVADEAKQKKQETATHVSIYKKQ